MRTKLCLHLLLISALMAAAPALAETKNSENTLKLAPGAVPGKAEVADLAWLTGYWRGEGLGGDCEEGWGSPIGDRMLGWFSLRKEEALVFSEATMIVEEEGSLVLKVKHFNPDFSGWEEKDDYVSFRLVKLGEREAFFEGLTFRRLDDDNLVIYLVLSRGGEKTEQQFTLRRAAW